MKTMILGQEDVMKQLLMGKCLDLMELSFRQLALSWAIIYPVPEQ
jgi:hypothetical protein